MWFIKIPELRPSGVFIVNFELISRIVLVFPLLTLNNWITIYHRVILFFPYINSQILIEDSMPYQVKQKSICTWFLVDIYLDKQNGDKQLHSLQHYILYL